jgi:hypothetical protein
MIRSPQSRESPETAKYQFPFVILLLLLVELAESKRAGDRSNHVMAHIVITRIKTRAAMYAKVFHSSSRLTSSPSRPVVVVFGGIEFVSFVMRLLLGLKS